MVNPKDIYNYLNDIMPFEIQEKWDNSGLLVNCGTAVEKVLCCLDVTKAAVDKAEEENCQLITIKNSGLSLKSEQHFLTSGKSSSSKLTRRE